MINRYASLILLALLFVPQVTPAQLFPLFPVRFKECTIVELNANTCVGNPGATTAPLLVEVTDATDAADCTTGNGSPAVRNWCRFNPATDTWQDFNPSISAVLDDDPTSGTACLYTGEVVISKDGDADDQTNSIWVCLDPSTNLWGVAASGAGGGLTTEGAQDAFGNLLVDAQTVQTGIAITYDDPTDSLSIIAEVTQAELDSHSGSVTAHHTAPTASTLTGTDAGTDLTVDLEEESQVGAVTISGTPVDHAVIIITSPTTGVFTAAIPDCETENHLTYDQATRTFGCEADDGGGGGMTSFTLEGDDGTAGDVVTNAEVVTMVGGVGIDTNDGDNAGAAAITFTLDLTEISTAVLGAGSFTTLTFDAGAVDPVLTASTGVLALTTGELRVGANRVLDVSDEGSGNSLDADSVDGLEATAFCRSDGTTNCSALLLREADIDLGLEVVGGIVSTLSTEAGFLEDGGVTSLVCGAGNAGKMQVMDDGDLEWCDGATTPALSSVDTLIDARTLCSEDNCTLDTGDTIAAGATLNVDGSEVNSGTVPAARVGDDHIDNVALTEIAEAIKTATEAADGADPRISIFDGADMADGCVEVTSGLLSSTGAGCGLGGGATTLTGNDVHPTTATNDFVVGRTGAGQGTFIFDESSGLFTIKNDSNGVGNTAVAVGILIQANTAAAQTLVLKENLGSCAGNLDANCDSVTLQAPESIANGASVIYRLPGVDGSSNDALVTDGGGVLSFLDMATQAELDGLVNNSGRAGDVCTVVEIDPSRDREKVICTCYDGTIDTANIAGEVEASVCLTDGHFEAWRSNCTGGPPFTSCDYDIQAFYMHEAGFSTLQGDDINEFITEAGDILEEWDDDGGGSGAAGSSTIVLHMPAMSSIAVSFGHPIWVAYGDPDSPETRTVGSTNANIIAGTLPDNTDVLLDFGYSELRGSTMSGDVTREDGENGGVEVDVEAGDLNVVFSAGDATGWHVGNILCFGPYPHNDWGDCGMLDTVPTPTATDVTMHRPATQSMEDNDADWTLYQGRALVVEANDVRVRDVSMRLADGMAPFVLDTYNLATAGGNWAIINSTCDADDDAGNNTTTATCCSGPGTGTCDPTRIEPIVFTALLGSNTGFDGFCDSLGPLFHEWDFWVHAGTPDGNTSPRSSNGQHPGCRLRRATISDQTENAHCVDVNDPYTCCDGAGSGTCDTAGSDADWKAMHAAQAVGDGACYIFTTQGVSIDTAGCTSGLRYITLANNTGWQDMDLRAYGAEDNVQLLRSYGWRWGTVEDWSQEMDMNCFGSGAPCMPDDVPLIEIVGRPMTAVAGHDAGVGGQSNDTVNTSTQGEMLYLKTSRTSTGTDPTGHDFVQTTAQCTSDGTGCASEEQDVLNIIIEGQIANFDTLFDVPDAATVSIRGTLNTDNTGALAPATTAIDLNGLVLNGVQQGVRTTIASCDDNAEKLGTDADGDLFCDTNPAGGSGYSVIENAGTPVVSRSTLNWLGVGISCADDAIETETDCTINALDSAITSSGVRLTSTGDFELATSFGTAEAFEIDLSVSNLIRIQNAPSSTGITEINFNGIQPQHNGDNLVDVGDVGIITSAMILDDTIGGEEINPTFNLDGAWNINSNADAEIVTFDFASNLTLGGVVIQEGAGNPTGGTLFTLTNDDAQVTTFSAGDGTNGIELTGNTEILQVTGTGQIIATSGDSATAFFSAGAVEDARLDAALARDAELTEVCVTGGMDSPDATKDRIVPGPPFAITIQRVRCHAAGTTPSITLELEECDNAGAACDNDGDILVTCNGGIDEEITITDPNFDIDDAWNLNFGTPSGTVTYLTWTICYDRQVVQ